MEGKRSLSEILSRAESVMKRSDELKPINSPNEVIEAYVPKSQQYLPQQQVAEQTYSAPLLEGGGMAYGEKGVGAKNLPPQIRAIMENSVRPEYPIDGVDSGLQEFIKQKKMSTQNSYVNENQKMGEVITISKTDLKDLIKEAVDDAMKKYKKVVEETTIKRTIASLLKEQKKRV